METESFREQYRPWRPIGDIPDRLYLEAMHDDYEGLRFLLRGDDSTGPTLRLAFDSPVGFRNINESYRIRTWGSASEVKELPSLLIVENSRWVRWLIAEAGGVLQPEALVHYALYTPEDCIDIVTESLPTVEWLGV